MMTIVHKPYHNNDDNNDNNHKYTSLVKKAETVGQVSKFRVKVPFGNVFLHEIDERYV